MLSPDKVRWILLLLFIFPIYGFSDIKMLFGQSRDQLIYFHSHTATPEELLAASIQRPVFEIDLAWAHSAFHPLIVKDMPYIGHPEECYTVLKNPFPEKNVSLQEFQQFLKSHPSLKVLIDIKDESVFPYLDLFVREVGSERCIVHACIKNWTVIPRGIPIEPHWYREDIDLYSLDEVLSRLNVPCIANCRGFNDAHVQENGLLFKMLEDAKKCKSVVCLGIYYYPGAPLPRKEILEEINREGFYAWVNGNIKDFREKLKNIRYIAMSDDMKQCTSFLTQ